MTEIYYWSAEETAAKIRQGEVSITEVTEAHLQRIEQVNPKINAITTTLDESLEQAKTLDAQGIPDDPPVLYGVPVTTKTNADQAGQVNSNGLPASVRNEIDYRQPKSLEELVQIAHAYLYRSEEKKVEKRVVKTEEDHMEVDAWFSSQSQQRNPRKGARRGPIVCDGCGQYGHIRPACPFCQGRGHARSDAGSGNGFHRGGARHRGRQLNGRGSRRG